MTDLFHGTTILRQASILAEGLRGPAFLAESRDVALRYAKARCAAAFERRLDARALVLRVSVDDVRPDPFHALERDQYIADDGIAAEAITDLEVVDLGWSSWPSWERSMALADWASMQRVRDEGRFEWRPAGLADARRDRQATLDLRAGLIDP